MDGWKGVEILEAPLLRPLLSVANKRFCKFSIFCSLYLISYWVLDNTLFYDGNLLATAVKPLEYQVEYRALEQSLNITM